MQYTYRYPRRVRVINGRRVGTIMIPEDHLAQTHRELIAALGDPRRTVAAQVSIGAPVGRIWEAIGCVRLLLAHQPRYAGLTRLNTIPSDQEGSRYVIHRAFEGEVFDRIGELLICLPETQLSLSDIDIADPSVSGHFQSLFTLRLDPDDFDANRTTVRISYTSIGVLPALIPAVLLMQLRSIQETIEEVEEH